MYGPLAGVFDKLEHDSCIASPVSILAEQFTFGGFFDPR